MDSDRSFDPAVYMRAPAFSLARGIALAKSLVQARPATAPDHVVRAAARLTEVHEAAQAAWGDRQSATTGQPDPRPVDLEADRSWSALRSRLIAYGHLPDDRHPRAARARELVEVLFGDGLAFLRATFAVQFETMDTLLRRIDGDGLAADIDALAGPEFLAQIRHVHPRYEAMVREMATRDGSPQHNLSAHLRSLRTAVVSYALAVCSTVDHADAATVARARAALLPIDNLRDRARAAATPGDAADPEVADDAPQS